MFEDRYREYYQKLNPSDELNAETLALMQEAQDHRAAEPEKPLRWRPAYTVSIAGTAAAVVAVMIMVGFWFGKGTRYDEMSGDLDTLVLGGSQTSGGTSESLPQGTDDSNGSQETENGAIGVSSASSGNSASPAEGDKPGSTGSADPDSPADNTDQQPADGNSSPAPGGDEPGGGQKPEEQPGQQPETPVDPREPVIINNSTTRTYTTIRSFLNALSKKTAEGYGSNYYTARELIIVPSLLPDNARFRHFYLYPETGKYAYSYVFTADGKDYIIDIKADIKAAKTLKELNQQKAAVAEEQLRTNASGNQLMYLFGSSDLVTVTLTAVGSAEKPTQEQVAALLAQFKLERCSLTNPIVDMAY